MLNINLLNEVVSVTNDEAFETARRLAREEGLLAGISSGAAMAATLKVAERLDGPATLVTVFASTGERYQSTELFAWFWHDEPWMPVRLTSCATL